MRGRGGGKSLPGGGCLDTRTKVSRTGQAGSHLSLWAASLESSQDGMWRGPKDCAASPRPGWQQRVFGSSREFAKLPWSLSLTRKPLSPGPDTPQGVHPPPSGTQVVLCALRLPRFLVTSPSVTPRWALSCTPELHPSPPVTVTPFGVTASVKPDEIANPGGLLTHRP